MQEVLESCVGLSVSVKHMTACNSSLDLAGVDLVFQRFKEFGGRCKMQQFILAC